MTETIPKSSEGGNGTKDSIWAAANALGLTAFFADDYELQLDLDQPYGRALESVRIRQVLKDNGVTIASKLQTRSKSGNMHVYFRLATPMTCLMRIALQACLGSDPVREVLSVLRDLKNAEETTALFETADEAKKVVAWRASCIKQAPDFLASQDDDGLSF